MWTLLFAQWRYRRTLLTFAATLVILVTWPQALWFENFGVLRSLGMVTLLVGGLGTNMMLWTTELREQRLALLTQLPVSIRQIARARLLSPVVIQTTATLLVFPSWGLAWVLWGLKDPQMFPDLFGMHGFGLMTILVIHLQEEMSLAVPRERWIVVSTQLVFSALFVAMMLFTQDLIRTWTGAALSHGVALLAGVAAFQLFIRRRDYLRRISPMTGFPENWQEHR